MISPPERIDPAALDDVAVELVQRALLLTRLVFRAAAPGISRTEASLLATLRAGPQRITSLAALEGLAQPTVTSLVKRLEKEGWVLRERAPEDARVVLVSLAEDGWAALAEMRERYRPLLSRGLSQLPDEQVAALLDASEALAVLIDVLQQEGMG
jgi:DNA-binding MarR family transcriptional regulator